MPVRRNAHHAQLFATPPARTKLVTRFGVSVLNVVATIDVPMSHQGAARPDVKNSAVLRPARLASRIAGVKEMAIETRTIAQSKVVGCIYADSATSVRTSNGASSTACSVPARRRTGARPRSRAHGLRAAYCRAAPGGSSNAV